MKISPVSLYNLKITQTNFKNNQNCTQNQNTHKLPDHRFYQSFLGGYTLNLKQTYQNLSLDQYPSQDIISMVQEEIKKPNSDKTLYDIHFEKYKKLLDCYSLEELKSDEFAKLFPELQDAVSENDVYALKGSFIDNYRCGQYDIFNNGEDLTLQIIKLYWGQGFSLSDLSNYIADNSADNKPVNLYYTMKKLNIPIMKSKYGSVLKLSNKEYNEKFSAEMSIKRLEAKEAKQQLAEGEAVIIPQGELSDAHKKHISEGLKKHFQQHPEKIFEMSKRQKKFYEENPQKKEELSVVMDYAWNKTQEGKSVARGLSKFIKKFGSNIQSSDIGSQISLIDKAVLEMFWSKNSWAKTQFSQAVLKGWEYLKKNPISEKSQSEFSETIKCRIYPEEICKKIKTWAKQQGYIGPLDNMGKVFLYTDKQPYSQEDVKFIDFVTDAYFQKFPKDADDMATSIQIGLISSINELYNNSKNLPQDIRKDKNKIDTLKFIFEKLNEKNNIYNLVLRNNKVIRYPQAGIRSAQLFDFYSNFVEIACANDCSGIIDFIEKKIDDGYCAVIQSNKGYPKLFRDMLGINS